MNHEQVVNAHDILTADSRLRDKNLKLSESMKGCSLHLTFAGAVMALGIFTSCTAQTTHSTRVSEVKDRHNFRDEQEGAPRADNASIER